MHEKQSCQPWSAEAEVPAERSGTGNDFPLPEADYEWLQLALFPPGTGPRQHDVVLEPYAVPGAGTVLVLGVLLAMFGAATVAQGRSSVVQQLVGAAMLFSGAATAMRGLWVARFRRRCLLPRLVLSVQPLYLGERFTVRFEQHFRTRCHLQHVVLRLVCREEVRWRHGEETMRQEEEIFHQQQLAVPAKDVAPGSRVAGRVEFTVPAEAMHSFSAPCNQIRWRLELEIAVAGQGEHREQFPLLVAPRRVET